ncbi:rod shape-determining protein MreC [Seleniivibrio woodruffii]|uniref:Cell shape-determining protein MreC n=1 Tax=Seleniivibrio woodruffii TaxID=1078050 RepID=A0A4R1K8K2_9BACT|nr:rod shape-determining protein MreC [Seleniivibrio woodruffii]TCK60655.1 rod shape-determining protein MreC [Seleniivibrio woodruffii]TVZ36285.1 rod shape-determining protein MreC [Seleniivibrio woodruffii]
MKLWKKSLIAFIALLILVIIQARNPEIKGPFRGIIGNFVNPLVYYTEKSFSFFSDIWSGYINLVDVRRQNDRLKEANGQLMLENSLLREQVKEHGRIARLLKFKDYSDLDFVPTTVIGRNVKGYLKFIVIDRGSRDGIKRQDPVISFNGLVGMVREVYPDSAEVEVVLSPASNVSVMNNRTRTVGMVRGNGHGGMTVDFYDRLDGVKKGDTMVTSGLGGVYPKGLVVGYVDNVKTAETGLFKIMTISSKVRFEKLENVLVIRQQ